jgi:hypothetical protein
MLTPIRTMTRGLLLALIIAIPLAASAETLTLHSGNGTIGTADADITVLAGSAGVPLSSSPFTTADFVAACSGSFAKVVAPYGPWLIGLDCDPDAKWIGVDPLASPASAIYCHPFDVETCCIESATLTVCWATDDTLGDASHGGANPDGVYLNGVAVSPSVAGGDFITPSSAVVDVTGMVECGPNALQIYNRDVGIVVSGVIYSATIDIVECNVPVEERAWGDVKALY